MENLLEQHYARLDKKLSLCCGQLGAYESLLNYAIDALRGKTASTGESLADYLESRQDELLEIQNTEIFNRKSLNNV